MILGIRTVFIPNECITIQIQKKMNHRQMSVSTCCHEWGRSIDRTPANTQMLAISQSTLICTRILFHNEYGEMPEIHGWHGQLVKHVVKVAMLESPPHGFVHAFTFGHATMF
jgi:hypothetical protein